MNLWAIEKPWRTVSHNQIRSWWNPTQIGMKYSSRFGGYYTDRTAILRLSMANVVSIGLEKDVFLSISIFYRCHHKQTSREKLKYRNIWKKKWNIAQGGAP